MYSSQSAGSESCSSRRLSATSSNCAEIGLPGMVGAVGEPDRERGRSELDDRARPRPGCARTLACGRRGRRCRTIRTCRTPRRHRWSTDCPGTCWSSSRRSEMPSRGGVFAQRDRVGGIVPRHVEADGAVRAGQPRCNAAMSSIFSSVVRGSPPIGEAAEARATGADRPGRCGHREAGDLVDHRRRSRPRVESSAPAASRGRDHGPYATAFDADDGFGGDLRGHRSPPGGSVQRRKAAATPPSTGTRRPVVRDSAPPMRAMTASATCSGSTSCRSRVRDA